MSRPLPFTVASGRADGKEYRLHERIGTGGMGSVYRGEQCALGRTVAIKLLHPELAAIPELVQRFHLEARAASRLSHRGSVAIYDYGMTADGTPFLVMEYVSGQTLARLIRDRWPVSLHTVIDLAKEILSALGEAHAAGVIHGDIKSDNVLVQTGPDGVDHPKLVDYGLARIVGEAPDCTEDGVCGTPEYMAPEVASGEPATMRSDLYAVGALIYEMLTGQPPFVCKTPQEVLERQVSDIVIPPSLKRPDRDIPMALEAVVMRALAKGPLDRFRDTSQFSAALERARARHDFVTVHPALPTPTFIDMPTRSWDATELGRTKTRLARGSGAHELPVDERDAALELLTDGAARPAEPPAPVRELAVELDNLRA